MNPIIDNVISQQKTTVGTRAQERVAQAGGKGDTASQEGELVTSAQTDTAATQPKVDDAALKQAIEQINSKAAGLSPALKFEPDSETGVVVITVMNRVTGEVIRQLPPEAVVRAAANGGDDLPALVELSV